MLNPFWNWFSIVIIIASILGCWWLLHWTKGISDRDDEGDVDDTGHVWDHNIRELNNPLPRWWLHLFNITIVFSLVYLVLYPGLGNVEGVRDWTQEKKYEREMEVARERTAEVLARFEGMEPEALRASSDAMDIGRRLYINHCSMCHGSDGRGGVGFPNLTDDSWQWGASFDNILYAINNGRVAAMPALGAAWDDAQMNSVVAYVRSLSGLEHDTAAAQAGEQTFTMLCAACHGPEGKGNPVLGAQNLTDDYWLYGSDRESLRTTLRQGRNGNMPAHEGLMSETQRRILAAYVGNLSRSGN
jgi:cytochrome c oxidase cbb3-type subunit 3